MKQPVKNKIVETVKLKKIKTKIHKKIFKKSIITSELDGSGLETFFRIEILDKLNIKYIQQFKAKSIGRYYDFYLEDFKVLIECDGSFFHSDPSIYNKSLTIVQKRNKRIDKIKDEWALMNGYILLRFWESDIKKEPEKVAKYLIERLQIATEIVLLNESKKNGTFFRKKI